MEDTSSLDSSESEFYNLHTNASILTLYQDAARYNDALRDEIDAEKDGLNQYVVDDLDRQVKEAVEHSFQQTGVKDILPSYASEISTEPETLVNDVDDALEILIQEFGSLGPNETLVLEVDGGVLLDVAVVGVIHLTTHRLTFHASVYQSPPTGSIKAGSVVVHTPHSWLPTTRQRVWMELTPEMLSTFASSSVESKIQPIKAVLLSFVKEVKIVKPQTLEVVFSGLKRSSVLVDVDSEVSARDWKREIDAAVYLYKNRAPTTSEDGPSTHGVRVNIPLERIFKLEFGQNRYFPEMATLYVEDSKFALVPLTKVERWITELPQLIEAAKRRTQGAEPHPIFVDAGPVTLVDNGRVTRELEGSGNELEDMLRKLLGFSVTEDLWATKAWIVGVLIHSGYLVVTPSHIGFYSKAFRRYRIPLSNVRDVVPGSHVVCYLRHTLTLKLNAHEDIRFDFRSQDYRDEALTRIRSALKKVSSPPTSPSKSPSIESHAERALTTLAPLKRSITAISQHIFQIPAEYLPQLPKPLNIPRGSFKLASAKHFVCLTIGSRGDVQPYIALAKGLQADGHRVTIVTHGEYKEWIEGWGVGFREAGGDPGLLMKLSVDNKMFSPNFFKESLQNFRPWLDQLLLDAWEACSDADVLLESPSAMAGVHIAEALNIPYVRTFTMPWTKTVEFPHAFLSPPCEAPTFNAATYILFHDVMWMATSGQINKWRRNTLKIGNTNMGHVAQTKIPFIYNFSTSVVPKPLDWTDNTVISGYWFLDNPELNWKAPADLLNWMRKAREQGRALVYIGFGSITVPKPSRVTKNIVQAVQKSGVYAIVSKGWSARMSQNTEKDEKVEIPPECYMLDKVPHDWLFPQIDAVLHHGGAGTTGASLRAGVPTLIKPWFGDQFFWASRVQNLGVGQRLPNLGVDTIADALVRATTDRLMKEKAALVGENIRAENGVQAAIAALYDMTRWSQST